MVKDAEAHADEDRKFQELVSARNQADNMIHATEKSLSELGDKVEAAERAAIESAVSDLKEALKGDDKDVIEKKTEALAEASGKLAERMYQQQGPEGAEGAPGAEAEGASAADDDVVDAEFEEVDDKK
jgi:molecular chaperone DnaK